MVNYGQCVDNQHPESVAEQAAATQYYNPSNHLLSQLRTMLSKLTISCLSLCLTKHCAIKERGISATNHDNQTPQEPAFSATTLALLITSTYICPSEGFSSRRGFQVCCPRAAWDAARASVCFARVPGLRGRSEDTPETWRAQYVVFLYTRA